MASKKTLNVGNLEALGVGSFETNDAYVTRLRRAHAKKTGFWSLMA
jgi:hypothetical protein